MSWFLSSLPHTSLFLQAWGILKPITDGPDVLYDPKARATLPKKLTGALKLIYDLGGCRFSTFLLAFFAYLFMSLQVPSTTLSRPSTPYRA
jgi:hypothetical protein